MNTTGKRHQLPGDKMKQLRLELGLEQKEVAERVARILLSKGIVSGPNDGKFSQAAYSRYENNKISRWPHAQMDALAEVLGTTRSYLLGIYDDFSHFTDEIRDWLMKGDSVPYVKEAYIKYINEKTR